MGLTGVLYVLDEPSIGLHQRDNARLLETLRHLRDIGNTVIVVEHDEEAIRSADYLIDLGVGAGVHGGISCFRQAAFRHAFQKEPDGQVLRGDLKTSSRRAAENHQETCLEGLGRDFKQLKMSTSIFRWALTCVTGVSVVANRALSLKRYTRRWRGGSIIPGDPGRS